jgi:hypothetical protein
MTDVLHLLSTTLRSFVDRSFSIIVNDVVLMYEGRRVSVRYTNQTGSKFGSKVVFFTITNENGRRYETVLSDAVRDYLVSPVSYSVWYGIDFSSYLENADSDSYVELNPSLRVVFLESPVMYLFKQYSKFVNSLASNQQRFSINDIRFQRLDESTTSLMRREWPRLAEWFRFDAMDRYINLAVNVFSRKVFSQLQKDRRRLFFSPKIGTNKINFVYLFLEIKSLYNPFLDDSTFQLMYGNTKLFTKNQDLCRGYKFIKQIGDIVAHCITPRGISELMNLSRSLNWDVERALRYIVANVVNIPVTNMLYPTKDVFYCLPGDYANVTYVLPEGDDAQKYERHSHLQVFCFHQKNFVDLCRRGSVATAGIRNSAEMYQILSDSNFVLGDEKSGK